MICEYENGARFLSENEALLRTNKPLAAFFFWDAPLLLEPDRRNYALKAERGGERLLFLKVEPFAGMPFGSAELAGELADHLMENGYEIGNLLGAEDVCGALSAVLEERYGRPYREALGMDLMQATEETEPSCPEVEIPGPGDLDEILDCLGHFIADCGLSDRLDREKTLATMGQFRVLRRNGKIASMAKIVPSSDEDRKISDVYTRPEYRGQKLARQVVNTAKNEILRSGKAATLNVDRKNPVSNHLYTSLGFVRILSQGEYRPLQKEEETLKRN